MSKRTDFDKALEGLSRGSVVEVAWRHYQRAEKAEARSDALTELLQLRPGLDIAFMDWAKWCKKVTSALAAEESPTA